MVVRRSRGVTYLPESPFLTQQQSEVIVAHDRGAETPGSVEPAPIGVAATQSMCPAQGYDLTVVEAHAAEDGAQVGLLFRSVGETAVGRAHADVSVSAARAPGNDGALHFLDGADAGEGPEVGVAYPWELLCA